MFYPVLRPLAKITLKLFFRKIYLTNQERIPVGEPVLLVSNHPTTFTEPCILACFLDRPLYYLVRGDFFENPVFNRMLRDLHMIPIYRIKDGGYKNLKNNFQTFKATNDWLNQNKTVMILAEGSAYYEKRLRVIRKGTARIAMGAIEKNPEMDLHIVPVGVNYTDSIKFGSEVMINFGEPFLASDFFGKDKGPKGKAINQFTKKIRASMLEHIVTIDQPKDDWLFDRLLLLQRNDHYDTRSNVQINDVNPLKREKALSKALNQLDEYEKVDLKEMAKPYFKQLNDFELSDLWIKQFKEKNYRTWKKLMARAGFFIGLIANGLPLQFMRYITNNIVIFNEFFGSVRIGASLGFFLAYYLILLAVLVSNWGILGFGAFVLFPLTGWFALKADQYLVKHRMKENWNKINDQQRKSIVDQRKKLIEQIQSILFRTTSK